MRAVLIGVAVVCVLGCGEKVEPRLPPSADSSGGVRPAQSGERPDITAGQISQDVVGKAVDVPEMSGSGPRDKWTFEADEYRRIEILERNATANGADLLVFMLSRGVPKAGVPDIQVSGHLRLRYEWQGKQWLLRRIDNVSFRYTLGVAT